MTHKHTKISSSELGDHISITIHFQYFPKGSFKAFKSFMLSHLFQILSFKFTNPRKANVESLRRRPFRYTINNKSYSVQLLNNVCNGWCFVLISQLQCCVSSIRKGIWCTVFAYDAKFNKTHFTIQRYVRCIQFECYDNNKSYSTLLTVLFAVSSECVLYEHYLIGLGLTVL